MDTIFSLAPLQGITDYTFRNLFCQHFDGADRVYTPFIRLQNDGSIRKSQTIDILPDNNTVCTVVPQILCNTASDFICLANYLTELGYDEINWNLGCPYPMVAKRQLGAGLLPFPDRIEKIMEKVVPAVSCKISIKIRSGYESEDEIYKILPVLEQFPITELIIHPRLGKQMYKGKANPLVLEKCFETYVGAISYNGDVHNIESFLSLSKQFKNIRHWMVGRAVVSNPFLFEELNLHKKIPKEKKMERFSRFHNDLFEFYSNSLSGPGHILNKMLHLWEYFSKSFTNSPKVYKKIKKANTLEKYNVALHDILNQEIFIA